MSFFERTLLYPAAYFAYFSFTEMVIQAAFEGAMHQMIRVYRATNEGACDAVANGASAENLLKAIDRVEGDQTYRIMRSFVLDATALMAQQHGLRAEQTHLVTAGQLFFWPTLTQTNNIAYVRAFAGHHHNLQALDPV